MPVVSVAEAKKHTRIDFNEDDDLVLTYLTAAEGYLSKIGVAIVAPIDPVARQAVLMLTAHLYNNREAAGEVNVKEIPLGLRMFIQSIRKEAL